MDNLTDRIERLLTKRNAHITLVILMLCTLGFGFALRNVRMDHDFENFFPKDDPELDRYLEFRKRFGNDNDFLLVAAEQRPTIFNLSFLQRFDSLARALGELPDVISVTTPTDLDDPRVTPLGVFRIPWLRTAADSTLRADSTRIWQDDRVRSAFFATDASAILMVMQTAPGISKVRSDDLMGRVQHLVDNSGIEGIRMGGRIHGQFWYIQKMLNELVLFFSISVLLLSIFLYLGFRTAWGVLVPIGVVGLSVLWQVGMITVLGKPLSLLTMLLPTILFVVGMSDVVHLLERYIEGLRAGLTKSRALAITYRDVGMATFLTSITTAIGFATLMTSSIMPIREFGTYTALGVLIAFLLAFTLLPAVLLLVPTPIQASTTESEASWYSILHRLYGWVLRNRKRIPYYFVALLVVAGFGIAQLKVNNFLLEDWPEDDPQKQDYYWLEQHFGGVRGFEMQLSSSAKNGSIWDLAELHEIETVQQFVGDEYGVQAILSPVTLVKVLNKAFNGGDTSFYRLPTDQRTVDRLVKNAKLFAGQKALNTLVTPDGSHARLTGRMNDEGGYVHGKRNKELEAFIAENTKTVVFEQTGMAYLIDRNNLKLSGQMIRGLGLALLLIGGIMAWVFRDLRMTLISLIPNVIPLLLIGGLMGYVGIDIKVSTAIIFTIAFGIAVDDTIHLLSKLKIELSKGKSLPYAMKRTFLSTGKAVLVTTIMLCSGFVALIFSDFGSVFYMGLLVSATLVIAVTTDLLLLPLLVLYWVKQK